MPYTHKTKNEPETETETAAPEPREPFVYAQPPQKLWWILRLNENRAAVAFDLRIPLEPGDIVAEFQLAKTSRVAKTESKITLHDGEKLEF